MFTNTPSDRMQLRGLGELPQPAQCMVCGNATFDEGYVDLGVWYEFYGNALLCGLCLTQAAELIGCMTVEEVAHLREQAENVTKELELTTEKLRVANERLNAFNTIYGSDYRGNSPILHIPDSPINEESLKPADIITKPVERSTSGESVTKESSEVQSGESSGTSELNVSDGKSAKNKRTSTFDI